MSFEERVIEQDVTEEFLLEAARYETPEDALGAMSDAARTLEETFDVVAEVSVEDDDVLGPSYRITVIPSRAANEDQILTGIEQALYTVMQGGVE